MTCTPPPVCPASRTSIPADDSVPHRERPGGRDLNRVPAPRPCTDYLAPRWRKPKPSERVLVAVKVSNSTGAGYGVAAVAAGVW